MADGRGEPRKVLPAMRILLFGANGQVGRALQRGALGAHEVLAIGREGREGLGGDLADPAAIAATVRVVAPDVIINAAAFTAVDRAESESALATTVNAESPAAMAQAAARIGAWLVHYSTDYVFDGSGTRPWTETDRPAPQSVYGSSKLAGEQGIRASGCRHLILRTSWVFGQEGGNFAATMLRLFGEREELRVVADQVGAPTSAEWLAVLTAHAISRIDDPALHGTYHATLAGETSWHAYAEYLLQGARARGIPTVTRTIHPIATADYPTPARRPLNSRLDCAKLDRVFGLARPRWQDAVEAWLDSRSGKG